ncbi:hypothetical protein [Baekduia sp. Peel2402]|uniref:hypothetical protein n=1 Tax=Baekduia sp. Peel2402 TaxID=3458296 RepID=UPI00403E3785
MLRTRAVAVLILIASLAVVPAAASAKAPRLDRSFGNHHGHWERGGAAWGTVSRVLPGRGGTALILGDDGRVARIGVNGKPDVGWGRRGVLRVTDGYWPQYSMPAARWGDRFTFLSGYAQTLVVDGRGRRLPVSDTVDAAVPPVSDPATSDWLAPDPDGSLWHLRTISNRSGSLQHIGPDGQPRGARVPLPGNGALGDGDILDPVATRAGIVVAPYSTPARRVTLRRLRADGTLDPAFRAVALGAQITAMLPWRDGVVVVGETRVLWVDGRGRIVRRSPLSGAVAVSFDSAGRLLVVGRTRDTLYVTVRRLRANGTRDRAFGTVKLAVPGDGAYPLAVIPAPGGRILVVGQALLETEGEGREDFGTETYRTVVWRLRTR